MSGEFYGWLGHEYSVPRGMTLTATTVSLRRVVLAAILVLLVQAGTGMAVNLYVTVPAHHSGAHPSNYIGGSVNSIGWAIAHGAPALAVHALLGLVIAVLAITAAVRAVRVAGRTVGLWAILAGCLVVGAGFNGASFLDFGNDVSSLIMALLALGAVACYAIVLFLVAEGP